MCQILRFANRPLNDASYFCKKHCLWFVMLKAQVVMLKAHIEAQGFDMVLKYGDIMSELKN